MSHCVEKAPPRQADVGTEKAQLWPAHPYHRAPRVRPRRRRQRLDHGEALFAQGK